MIRYRSTTQRRSFRLLSLLGLAVILFAQLGAPAQARPAPAQSPAEIAPTAPMSGKDVGVAHTLAGADQSPAPEEATVADARVSDWTTQYGTVAGRKLLPPRHATFEAAPQGPAVPLGAWRTVPYGGSRRTDDMVAAPDGRVFLASEGLLVYAPQADGSYTLSAIAASAGGLASNSVSVLVMNGWELYVGTYDAGLSVLDLRTNTWRTYNTGNSGLPSNAITTLTNASNFVNDTLIWIGTPKGAAEYDRDEGAEIVYALPQLAGQQIRAIGAQIVNGTQTFWFALESRIARWNLDTFTYYDKNNTGACSMDSAGKIVTDQDNNLWFAASLYGLSLTGDRAKSGPDSVAPDAQFGRGVCRYNTASGTWQLFSTVTPGLPTVVVTDLTVDAYNRVWMAFADDFPLPGGVAVYDQGTWRIFRKTSDPLLATSVGSVQAIGDAIWIGYLGAAGVNYYTPNWQDVGFGPARALLVETDTIWAAAGNSVAWNSGAGWSYQSIPGNTAAVTAFARDASGTLWVATGGNGLFTFNGTTFVRQSTADGLPSDDVRALYSDANGRFWAATSGGLALRGNGYWLNFSQANSGLHSDNLRALTGDADGRLWIGTADKGISIYDPADGANPWQAQTATEGLPSDTINALVTDPFGTIWAATPAGIGQYQAGAWTVPSAGEILSITSDPSGRIWAGTATGLLKRERG